MNKEQINKIQEWALILEKEFIDCSPKDKMVASIYESLKEIIERGKSGSITEIVDRLPSERFFLEGELYQYPELEKAYLSFSFYVSTKDPEKCLETMRKVDERIAKENNAKK